MSDYEINNTIIIIIMILGCGLLIYHFLFRPTYVTFYYRFAKVDKKNEFFLIEYIDTRPLNDHCLSPGRRGGYIIRQWNSQEGEIVR